jgi:hypothetical protein
VLAKPHVDAALIEFDRAVEQRVAAPTRAAVSPISSK